MNIENADYYNARAREVQARMDSLRRSMENLEEHTRLASLYEFYTNKAQTAPGKVTV